MSELTKQDMFEQLAGHCIELEKKIEALEQQLKAAKADAVKDYAEYLASEHQMSGSYETTTEMKVSMEGIKNTAERYCFYYLANSLEGK